MNMTLLKSAARAAAVLVLLAAGADAAPPPAAAPAPGTARVWFYRVFFPLDSRDMPAISMNGWPVGYANAGGSFYRDVPAGTYHVEVDSYGRDYDQSQTIAFAPGVQYFVKIESLPTWEEGTSRHAFQRGTYYVRLVTPSLASLELPQTTYEGSR